MVAPGPANHPHYGPWEGVLAAVRHVSSLEVHNPEMTRKCSFTSQWEELIRMSTFSFKGG